MCFANVKKDKRNLGGNIYFPKKVFDKCIHRNPTVFCIRVWIMRNLSQNRQLIWQYVSILWISEYNCNTLIVFRKFFPPGTPTHTYSEHNIRTYLVFGTLEYSQLTHFWSPTTISRNILYMYIPNSNEAISREKKVQLKC